MHSLTVEVQVRSVVQAVTAAHRQRSIYRAIGDCMMLKALYVAADTGQQQISDHVSPPFPQDWS